MLFVNPQARKSIVVDSELPLSDRILTIDPSGRRTRDGHTWFLEVDKIFRAEDQLNMMNSNQMYVLNVAEKFV